MLKRLVTLAALGLPLLANAAQMEGQASFQRMDVPGRDSWQDASLRAAFDGSGFLKTWGGAVQHANRYGASAMAGEVFGVHQIAPGMAVESRLSAGQGADFFAKSGVELTLYAGLPGGLELTTTAARKVYAADASSVLRIRLDREFGPWRLGGGVSRDIAFHEQVRFASAKYSSARWSAALHVSRGVEAERLASGAALRTPVREAALVGEITIAPQTRLRTTLSRTLTTQSRAGVSFGLIRTF